MEASTWLLFAIGCLGGTDILLFHSIGHGLRKHPPSRNELWSHACRGPVYAALFVLIPSVRLEGAWFWALLALLAVDLLISVWDFSVESRSRAPLGGLPTGEYLLHVAIAMVFGALVATTLFEGGHQLNAPTRIAWSPAPVPPLLRWALLAMSPAVLLSGLLDARAALRLSGARRSA